MGDRQMKIYFCGSIRGGRKDGELYARIIKQLEAYGKVLTEHVGHKDCFTCKYKTFTATFTDIALFKKNSDSRIEYNYKTLLICWSFG